MKKKKAFFKRLLASTLILTMLCPLVAYADLNMRIAVIKDVSGTAKIRKAGGEKLFPAIENAGLVQGDSVITGKDSGLKLVIDGDKEVKIGENTQMVMSELMRELKTMGDKTSITLLSGKILITINKKLTKDGKFEIKTPTAVMGVRGTTLETIVIGNRTFVAVFEGTVNARNINTDREANVGAFQLAEITDTQDGTKPIEVKPVDIKELELFELEGLKDNPKLPEEILKQIDEQLIIKQLEELNKPPEASPPPSPTPEIIYTTPVPTEAPNPTQAPTPTEPVTPTAATTPVPEPTTGPRTGGGDTKDTPTPSLTPTLTQTPTLTPTLTLTPTPVAVSAITVTGHDGLTEINSRGGILQMVATVQPTEAVNKNVIWSVGNGTGTATISVTGLLTAITNGNVTVIATSTENGTITGSKVITISNQISNEKAIINTGIGTLIGNNVELIPITTKVSALKSGLTLSPYASAEILGTTGGTAVANQATTDVTTTMVVQITAEDGSKTEYGISSIAISSLEDLALITNASKSYVLTRDLDFNDSGSYTGINATADQIQWTSGTGWTPLPGFTAIFDGNGHKISNLYINSPNSNLALFSALSGSGTIKNLELASVNITGTAQAVGGQGAIGAFAGELWCIGYVLNSKASGVINCPNGDAIGGIVGKSGSGVVIGCSSSIAITGHSHVGGISGRNGMGDAGTNAIAEDCYVTGDISGSGSDIGGIMGLALTATIDRCYVTGNITGIINVGGLAGQWGENPTSKLINSFALSSSITRSAGASSFGRITGLNSGDITNCYANADMVMPSGINGVPGTDVTLGNAKILLTYANNGWDIDNFGSTTNTVWIIDNGNAFPTLRVQNYSALININADIIALAQNPGNSSALEPIQKEVNTLPSGTEKTLLQQKVSDILNANVAASAANIRYSVVQGKAIILGRIVNSATALNIPATLGVFPVTVIGYKAFYTDSAMTGVTIPNSIITIEGWAFKQCTGLTEVTIPSSVVRLKEWAFRECTALLTLTIPDSVIVENEAFAGCTSLIPVDTLAPAGGDNCGTRLVAAFNQRLFINGTAIADTADVKDSFTIDGGVVITSAIYNALNKTITFTLVGPSSTDAIINKEDSSAITNIAGNPYSLRMFKYDGAVWNAMN